MAKKTGVELEFSILDDDFKKAIKEMNSSLASMRKELSFENEVLKSSSASISDYEKKLETLKTQQELSKNKVNETAQAYEKAKEMFGENSKEASKYKDALVVAQTEHQRITNEIDKTTDAMKNYETQLNDAEKQQKKSESALETLNKTIADQKETLDELKKQYVSTVLEQGKSSDEAKKLKSEIKDLSGEIGTNEKKLNDAEKELNKFADSEDDAGKHAITFGEMIKANIISDVVMSGLKKLADLAGQAFNGLKSLVSSAISVGSEFEASMSKVSAISGATGSDFDKLKKKAEEMGAKTKFSATESAEALQYMAMAGWKTNDMVDGLEGIMNLAAASGEELATTSDIVTDALTAFGMQANQSAHFADILAIASSNSNTNVAMMGETFKYAASIAGSLGYTAEDTALAIGLMANAGIKGTQAGTSLRSIMSRIATDTGGARSAMEELGITVVNSDGSMRDFGEVIAELRVKFQDLSSEEQANYAKTIAGQQALSGFLAIANSGNADFEKLSNAIKNCDGAAEDMAATMIDNLEGSKTLFKSAAEGLGISIYEGLQGPLNEVVKFATESVNNLNAAFQENGFEGLIDQAGIELTEWLNKIVEFLPKVVEAGGQLLTKLVEGITSNIPMLASSAVTIVTGLFNTIISNLPMILQAGITLIIELAKGIANALPTLVPTVVSVILEMVMVLTDPENLMNIIEAALVLVSSLAEGIIKAIPVLVEQLPEIINNITTFFTENLDKIIDTGVELIVNLAMALVDSIPVIIENLPKILTAIINGLLQILPKLATAGLQMMVKLGVALVENVPKIVSKIPQIITSIINGFANLITGAIDIGKNFVTGLWNGINNAKDWILGKIKGFKDAVIGGIKSFFGIHSPSTLFRDEVGKNLALGLGLGFTDEMKEVTDEMQEAIPTSFDVGVSANTLTNGFSNNINDTNSRSITDTSDYNVGEVAPIYLTIENFNNNREQDIEDLSEELEFYRMKINYGKGNA